MGELRSLKSINTMLGIIALLFSQVIHLALSKAYPQDLNIDLADGGLPWQDRGWTSCPSEAYLTKYCANMCSTYKASCKKECSLSLQGVFCGSFKCGQVAPGECRGPRSSTAPSTTSIISTTTSPMTTTSSSPTTTRTTTITTSSSATTTPISTTTTPISTTTPPTTTTTTTSPTTTTEESSSTTTITNTTTTTITSTTTSDLTTTTTASFNNVTSEVTTTTLTENADEDIA